MQRIQGAPHLERLLNDGAQIAAGAFAAVGQGQRGAIKARINEIILERLAILQILLGGAALHLIKRRLGDIEIAAVDHLGHLAVEEGEQQGSDMGAVDVGVGHDDDLVVAQLVDVEAFAIFVAADAGAECGDQRADFGRRQHLVEAGALDVEDFSAQGQHGLVLAVARLLGGAAGRVALDDEDFGLRGIAVLAFGQLAGKAGHIERALAAREVARLAGRFAGGGGFDHLARR